MQIAVYNEATAPLGQDYLASLVAAMQVYVDQFVAPAWKVQASLTLAAKPIPGMAGFVFLDDADSPGALAYHTVEDSMPIAKVFVRTVQGAGESLSVSASHELVEMLVDPGTVSIATALDGTVYALEAADPCEEISFLVNGVAMSDFVLPAYFDPHATVGPFDHCGVIQGPFTLAAGGYANIYQGGQWTNIFGSSDKELRFAREDRRGHRSEYRRLRAE